MPNPSTRLVIGATTVETLSAFVVDQAAFLATEGFEVHLVANLSQSGSQIPLTLTNQPGLHLHHLPMKRFLSPLHDFVSLIHWLSLLRRLEPNLIVVGTPKAGLLGILAASILRIHPRVYLLRGLRGEGFTGYRQAISLTIERLVSGLADRVLVVSRSLLELISAKGIVAEPKAVVLGWGSSNGVNTTKFRPPTLQERTDARSSFGLHDRDFVIGFAGRLTSDKGVETLLDAVSTLAGAHPRTKLLLVGALDETDALSPETLKKFHAPWCVAPGPIDTMQDFYWALDVFCLLSRREGFPNVNLEASASGLPVVTTYATGCRDSVTNEVSGLLLDVGDSESAASALALLASQPDLRERLGSTGRQIVSERFPQEEVWKRYSNFYKSLLSRPGDSGGQQLSS